jgi:accessory gene regulator protein AgrB
LSQSRLQSLLESLANVVLGYGVALGAQLIVFPLFGIVIPLASNIAIGIIFTFVSLLRSYVLRRLFNWLHS